eukprot:CAMPEP_0196659328 /NCGR_PEP_ID=MMETSP1086-20130531/34369_1 /TAXON_ID=77921 /ORGANISM="Cyanoptyche  gloeocystis , Strain SAG4.97" /LENGTH=894 /DNA_ID=CAMNT_0041993261 /DNA_START=46 /DNA_END=2730 /DNA_ORIENTATION=-
MASANPFQNLVKEVQVGDANLKYYSLPSLNDSRVDKLPFSIRILLESAIRNCDQFQVHEKDVEKILDWEKTSKQQIEIPFKPARVILQDFTGVPAVVDLAAMRDAMKRLGGDPAKINPLVPVDLVVDHSVQVDAFGSPEALEKNEALEFQRNHERFSFLKWGSKAFENLLIVPPGSGIVHQVNLEYLARVVFNSNGVLYPDSLVGTDSHTTMINGLGVCGWGVGGIEGEAVMLGQPMSMVLPEVVGYKLTGRLAPAATATDLVLTITQNLRKHGVVGKFVEFFGEGVADLSVADRATLANMAPEYGATMGFFPCDAATVQFLRQTGRDSASVAYIDAYLRANHLLRDYSNAAQDPVFSSTLHLDLATVVPCLAGPKRPHDRVALHDMKTDFLNSLCAKVGFKGYGLSAEQLASSIKYDLNGHTAELTHGSVVIAAITSCTNTSNPSVMLGAGLVAKKAVEAGLKVKPHVKTSLSPGSGVVTRYLNDSGLMPYLNRLGFYLAGYGCMTCIGNSGDLPEETSAAIQKADLVAAAVLSGNRNFEGRVHPLTRANYLASPPLVVVYALAGSVAVDFETQCIGVNDAGKEIFLRDIWPTSQEIEEVVQKHVAPTMFRQVYDNIKNGTGRWNGLETPEGSLYTWDDKSTYIHNPPFFSSMERTPPSTGSIESAYCLLNLGDSITTDHISPAGRIAIKSPAARYLLAKSVASADFNTYGARRGNDEVMARGTFANTQLLNKMMPDYPKPSPKTVFVPTNEVMDIFDAADKYKLQGVPTIILAGAEYGSGSSRDWAAKGPYILGVKAVIAISYERIHRSNLVGMGIVPLQFKAGDNADTLGLTGKEQFTIDLSGDLSPGSDIPVKVSTGKSFVTTLRFDTPVELTYYRHGGILHYVLRQLLA